MPRLYRNQTVCQRAINPERSGWVEGFYVNEANKRGLTFRVCDEMSAGIVAPVPEIFAVMTCFKHHDPKWACADGCFMTASAKTATECQQMADYIIRGNPPTSNKHQDINVLCFKKPAPAPLPVQKWEQVR